MSTQITVPGKAATPAKSIDILKGILDAPSVMKQFENAMAKSAPTFIASVIDLFNGDSKLQLCDPKQVVNEALKAAVLHLPINKSLGYAYIIPFNNSKKVIDYDEKGQPKIGNNGKPLEKWVKVMEPTFQMGYKGYIQLAMRTGQYRTINADMVYEGECRKVSKLTGEIAFDGEKVSDKVVGYFCYFELLNGFSKTLYMTVEQMAKHAKRYSPGMKAETTEEQLINLAQISVTSKTVGWMGNFNDMAVKTVIRNLLSKYGYLSIEMQTAIENDFAGEDMATGNRDQSIISYNAAQVINIDDTQAVSVIPADVKPSSEEPEDINPGY